MIVFNMALYSLDFISAVKRQLFFIETSMAGIQGM